MGLRVKSESDGSVVFEGYANKAIVDRGNDMIGKKAWKLDNYKKNPIVLFNHDHTKPIGKMLDVQATDEGLFVKGRISNSKDPDISRIRDLVKEGILNSLSVGMRVHDEDRQDGINVIKSAELHEISVVAVPMNQDSQFTASTKTMEASLVDVMEVITKEVGPADVSKAYEKLHKSAEVFEDFKSMSVHIAKETGVTAEDAEKFLKMEAGETPEAIKGWLSKSEEETPEETESPEEEAAEGEDNPMKGKQVHAILVPKASIESAEELSAWAEAGGWKADMMEENDDDYILVQTSKDQFSGEMQTIDLGDGIRAMVGVLTPKEESTESEGAEDEKPGTEEGQESGGMEETGDESKGLLDGGNGMTVPLEGKQPEQIEINPSLDAQRQTNVLLANVVSLLQQMNEKLSILPAGTTGMITPTTEQRTPTDGDAATTTEQTGMTPEEEELAKSITGFIQRTENRLKALGL
jgi:HK97 family phage prohead protease